MLNQELKVLIFKISNNFKEDTSNHLCEVRKIVKDLGEKFTKEIHSEKIYINLRSENFKNSKKNLSGKHYQYTN